MNTGMQTRFNASCSRTFGTSPLKLLHAREFLTDGGLLYVSVPKVINRGAAPTAAGMWATCIISDQNTYNALAARTGFQPVVGVNYAHLPQNRRARAWTPNANVARRTVSALPPI